MVIRFSEAAEQRVRELRLTEELVGKILQSCEEESLFVLQEETGRRFCHRRTGSITCWIEYTKEENDFRVLDVYMHRIRILEEDRLWQVRGSS